MKKILTIIILISMFLVIVTFIFLPKENFSEIENRSLSTMPKPSIENVLNGAYMEKTETYITDHFPLRTLFMNIKTFYTKLIGKQDINDVYLGRDGYLLENYDSIDYIEELANTVNKFYESNININVSMMLVPTKISIYEDKLPNNVNSKNQKELINIIYDKVNNSINKIDLYDTFISEKDNYQLYYKTDHHWTSYGAYVAYKQYIDDYIDIKYLNKKELTSKFKGSTYSKVIDFSSKNETIEILEYKNYDIEVDYVLSNKKDNSLYNLEYLNKKDKYALFLDNNHPLIVITNKDVKKNNILVIKDSYANSFIPFLVNHYNEIHVIDPRYYKKSITNYINENSIDNVLILYNVGTLSEDKNILSIR